MYSSGPETSRSVTLLRAFQVREFNMDVSAGQHGGPVWTYDGVTRAMTGVVSYGGDEVAGGVWFGGDNTTTITAFVAWAPDRAAPGSVSENLHVAVAFPSGNLAADSYVRFYNASPQPGVVTVNFAEGETGAVLAAWTSPTLPPFSSKQFSVADIEIAARPRLTSNSRGRYTLDMTSTMPGYFQHVLWNRGGASLTNVSSCGNGSANDVLHLNNVHSSLIAAYPSVIMAHNIGAGPSDVVIGVYISETGARIGGVRIPAVPPNASASFHIHDVEAALGFTPAHPQGPYHYNLVQEGDFPGYLQHLVYNNVADIITNMTGKCVLAVH